MPFEGFEKKYYNFTRPRIAKQKEFWPSFCDKWDEEQNGKRFKSEVLSLRELWNLYIGGVSFEPDAEEAARGKKTPAKKDRGFEVIPAKARFLLGRYNEEGYLHFYQWLLARDQARKDLFFLCKVFGMDVEPHVHQVVCDQFVQK